MHSSQNFKLKLITQNDSDEFYELIQSNLKRLEDFFAGTVSKTQTREATKKYCIEIEGKIAKNEYFPYLIIESESKRMIGLIDLKNINWNIPKGELGFFIDSGFEGKGITSLLATTLIEQIVKEHRFKKLYCRVAKQNTRSISLVKRIGFILEGTIRRDYKTTKGELVDLNYYGMIFN